MQSADIPRFLRKRYLVVGLSTMGFMILFILRINLSVCIVDMTSNRTLVVDNETYIQPAEYAWSSSEKGILLSCFSWGFLTAPLVVTVTRKFNATNMYAISIFLAGVLTILSPFLIQHGFYVYIVGRFMEGVAEAITAAALYAIFSHWIPPNERSRSINFSALGVPMGVLIGYPLSGYISYVLSWRYVFYVTGTMSIVYSVLWISLVRNTPAEDVLITKQEKQYLLAVLEPVANKKVVKNSLAEAVMHLWKSMLTSKPVLAYLNESFVQSWSVSFMIYCLPLYIKDMHDVNIDEIGILAALPHICDMTSRVLGCWLQDYLRTKGTMSKTKIHKMYIVFGQISAVILLISIGLWNDFYGSMLIICLFKICFTIAELSYWVLPIDMALEHSSTVEGFVITSMSIGYFLNPLVMSCMVPNHTRTEWNHYFWFLSIFNLWGLLVFSRYGSAEPQTFVYAD